MPYWDTLGSHAGGNVTMLMFFHSFLLCSRAPLWFAWPSVSVVATCSLLNSAEVVVLFAPFSVALSFVVFFPHVLFAQGVCAWGKLEAMCCWGWCFTLCLVAYRSCMVMLYSWYMALYCVFLSLVVFQGLLFCFSACCYYKPSALQFCLEHVLRLNKKAETHAICVFFKMNSICFFVFFNVCCLRRYNDNIVFNVFTRLLSRRNFLQHFTFGILC